MRLLPCGELETWINRGAIKINSKIFNVTESKLLSTIYGIDENGNYRSFILDSNGKLILSPLLTINTEAIDLDMRDFNSTRDTATISAANLDLRNLNGTEDSIQIDYKSYVEDSDSGTIIALGTRIFLTKNISSYQNNYYLVRNTGGVAVTVTLQIAPVNIENYYVNSGTQFNIIAGGSKLFAPSNLMKYARISVFALLLGSVTVNYFGQS